MEKKLKKEVFISLGYMQDTRFPSVYNIHSFMLIFF